MKRPNERAQRSSSRRGSTKKSFVEVRASVILVHNVDSTFDSLARLCISVRRHPARGAFDRRFQRREGAPGDETNADAGTPSSKSKSVVKGGASVPRRGRGTASGRVAICSPPPPAGGAEVCFRRPKERKKRIVISRVKGKERPMQRHRQDLARRCGRRRSPGNV